MKAERETADRLIAHFLADRVGATFDGHISGVTRAGLFVELDETGADSLIPARLIGDDISTSTKKAAPSPADRRHPAGDPVTVELVEAAPVAGALRFRLVHAAHADRAERTHINRRSSAKSRRAENDHRDIQNRDTEARNDERRSRADGRKRHGG